MSKVLKTSLIVLLIVVVVSYSLYFYIYQNISWKLTGLDLQEKDVVPQEGVEGLLSKSTIADKITVNLEVKNNSNLPFSLSNLKLKIINGSGNEVGKIVKIRKVTVPPNSTQMIDIAVDNINEMALLSDVLSGGLSRYRYKVSGAMAGILPFAYSDTLVK